MASILEFCLDGCLDQEARDSAHDDSGLGSGSMMMSMRRNIMNRGEVATLYSPPQENLDLDSEIQIEDTNFERNHRTLLGEGESEAGKPLASQINSSHERPSSLISYFSFKFTNSNRNRTRKNEHIEGYSAPPSNEFDENDEPPPERLGILNSTHSSSKHDSTTKQTETILYEAKSFKYDSQDNLLNIPSIPENSFIMPGSDTQKKMAQALCKSTTNEYINQAEDECVICLDTFSYENPRMPTMCGCGENKASFHLPCLYQWIEKDKNCPTCRTELKWEEF